MAARALLALHAGAIVALIAIVATASGVRGAGGQTEIASVGPLTRIIVSGDLNCQVAHVADASFEFFGGELGACGTFVSIGGTLYGPEAVPSGAIAMTPWTPVTQAAPTGSGSRNDPIRIVTTVEAGASGVRVEQTDSYVIGDESYRTDIRLTSAAEQRVIVFRAGDCYLQDSDVGLGRVDGDSPACIIDPALGARIQQWEPITPGSRHAVGRYSDIWSLVSQQASFPNRCDCDQLVDNGAGLSWETTIPGGGETTVSHRTYFAPEGRRGGGVGFADSVPGPTDISLDPIVLASSVALAAGVVLAVPFPAALFNSTLEENYAEVTAGARRFTGWIGRLLAGAEAWIRRRLGRERAALDPGATDPDATPFWRTRRGFVTFIALSALVYCLLDPTFGLHTGSLATFAGLLLGLVLTIASIGLPLWFMARQQGVQLSASVLPGTIVIAIACVIISRVADFQPGYLYGLIIGFGFSRELAKVEQGRIEGITVACGLAASVVAWLLLGVVRGGAAASPIIETALVTLVVAGLEAALFGMLPLRFLPGERVRAWNRRFWMIVIGLAAFAFFHILLNPSAGYLAESERASMTTVIGLFVVFGGISVAFWAYYRFRPARGVAPTDQLPPA